MLQFQARLRRFRESDGLGLIEVVAALGVMVVALLLLAYLATAALNDVGLARQRQGANEIANRIIEQVRALPYTEATEQGLATADTAGDANILSCSGVLRLDDCSGEEIVHTARPTSPPAPPLVPHIVNGVRISNSPTEYTQAVYITKAANAPPSGAFRVTVVVSWTATFRLGASSQVEAQTLLFDPGFATAEFGGTSSIPQAGVAYGGRLSGSNFTARSNAGATRADLQSLGGTDRIQGRATASVVSVTDSAGTRTAGGDSVASDADNDPTTAATDYSFVPLTSSAGSVNHTSSGVSLTLATGADTGSTTSAVQATTGQACPRTGTETDALPCGHTLAVQGGDMSASLGVNASVGGVAINLGTTTMFSMPRTGTPATTFVDREAVSGADGRIEVRGTRRFGDIGFFSLPAALAPTADPDWRGFLVRLTGYNDTVAAQAGNDTAPPTATIAPGATLQYWVVDNALLNQGHYESQPFGNAPVNLNATFSSTLSGSLVEVVFGGALAGGTRSTSEPVPGPSGIDRQDASAQVASPVLGNFTYRLSARGTVLADLTFDINFGTHVASAQYVPAP